MDVFSNNKFLQKDKTEYINQHKEDVKREQDLNAQYNMEQYMADQAVADQNMNDYIAAEKDAGLEQKKIPKNRIPNETMNEIEKEYKDYINPGQQMSDKDRESTKRLYNKKNK